MARPEPDPPPEETLYSEKLKVNIVRSERLKRKVLEITLEHESEVIVKIEENDVAKLISRLGIDLKSQMVGYQICPSNSRKILLWLKDSCDLSRYCRDDSFEINDSVRAGTIRQMDKSEVAVTIVTANQGSYF